MSEYELNSLELQVDDFVKSFRQLNIESNSLHREIAHLHHERIALLNKKKKIAGSIRKIITELQDKLL
jgi:uncharacterized protein (TIGR02449 family)